MKKLIFVVLLFISGIAVAQDKGIHLVKVGEGEGSYEKLSGLKMQKRLIATAEQFKEFGPLARVSHHDMAYPKDAEEYDAMEGSGILWVTSHSQIQEELPLKNLRISIDGIGNLTTEAIFVTKTVEKDELVSSVLGEYRSDSVYVVPFLKEVAGAMLIADYSTNRTDFVLGYFPKSFPKELGPLKSVDDEIRSPPSEAFLFMLRREYPISANWQ
jgi:hypothetical protein